MYLFCPRCNTQHLASSRCPRCSSRLLMPSEVPDVLTVPVSEPPPPGQPGFAGRVLVGTVVGLGLHLALWEWALAALSAVGELDPAAGVWVGYALRVVGAGVGGVLAGAGRPQSFTAGAVVGAACGVGWLVVDAYPHLSFDPVRLAAAAALLVVGGAAAAVGGRVWPPPVEVKPPTVSRNSSMFRLKTTAEKPKQTRPIGWVRVVVAVTLTVCGVFLAETIRLGLTRLPQGLFNNLTMTARTDAIIAGFGCVLAGVIAGAATGRGGLQGMIAGAVAGLAVAGIGLANPDDPPIPLRYVLETVGGDTAQGLAAAAGVVFALLTTAGWFGGQLLPVLRKRKRLGE